MNSTELAPTNILIVDDLNENLIALEALLRGDGIRIHRATSGEHALELLLQHEFALAILDVQMPRMNGFELAEIMRGPERTRNIPIIFVTAGARSQGSTFKGYESGAVDFLYKPLDPLVVRSKVRVFIELYQSKALLQERLKEREEVMLSMREHMERLHETENRLMRVIEVRNDFLSIAWHEIKNPIAALKLQMELTQRSIRPQANETPSTANLQKAIHKSNKQIDRLLALVDDLLDPEKMDSGQFSYAFSPFSLHAFLSEALDRLTPKAEEKGNRIELLVENGNVEVVWDRGRIEQLLSNLVSNAIKYAPGSPIRVHASCSPSIIELRVSDEGPGIPPEAQSKVFERYERGNAPQGVQGLGLGLFIVQRIAEGHAGTATLRSEPGQGTEFIIRLPMNPAAV